MCIFSEYGVVKCLICHRSQLIDYWFTELFKWLIKNQQKDIINKDFSLFCLHFSIIKKYVVILRIEMVTGKTLQTNWLAKSDVSQNKVKHSRHLSMKYTSTIPRLIFTHKYGKTWQTCLYLCFFSFYLYSTKCRNNNSNNSYFIQLPWSLHSLWRAIYALTPFLSLSISTLTN